MKTWTELYSFHHKSSFEKFTNNNNILSGFVVRNLSSEEISYLKFNNAIFVTLITLKTPYN